MTSPISEGVVELQEICERRGWKVGLAESCTGGLLSAWITQRLGISTIYQGAVVSYSRGVKEQILGVTPAVIDAAGVVSEPVARAMARGARAVLGADWGASITGIVGPGGGSPETPVGTVCFAVVGPDGEAAATKRFDGKLDREKLQRQSAVFAFEMLLRELRQTD